MVTIHNAAISKLHRWRGGGVAALAMLLCLGCERQSQPVVEAEPAQDVEAVADASSVEAPAESTAGRSDDEIEIRQESWSDGSPKSEKQV